MRLQGNKVRVLHAHYRYETPGHEMIPATWRIQGETDSFGAEYALSVFTLFIYTIVGLLLTTTHLVM